MATPVTVTPPNVLNNATVMFQSKFNPQKFTDQNFLYNNYSRDSLTVYKGLLNLWNQRGVLQTPLLNLTELKNSVMYVPNMESRFRFSIPYEVGLPFVVENLEADNQFAGRDGQRFKIKLSENCFSNTDVLTVDMRDGIQVIVTDEEIIEEADGWIYTVEIIHSSRRRIYYPQEFMQPGRQYMKIQNANGEYDTQMSSITTTSGFMDLEMELGGAHRSVTHWITGYADMTRLDESKDPKLARINQILGSRGSTTLYANTDSAGKVIPSTLSWHSTIEMLLRVEMETMTEKGLMWAQGGYISTGQGRTKTKVASGLYPQLRNGNRITYSGTAKLEFIEQQVANLFHNTGIPIEQRYTKIMTGQIGMNDVGKEIQERMKTVNPYLIQAKDIPGGLFYGGQSDAGFRLPRFTQYFSPVAGNIEFVHNPALDAVYGNRDQDGFIGGFPITSATFMILDVTDKNVTNATARINTKYRVENGFSDSSNIVLVKPQDYGELYWGYIFGTHSPFGPTSMKGMQSANAYNGYQIWMKAFGNLWLKDTTRTLIIEKERPGLAFNIL